MRKLLLAILCLPAVAWGTYQPITGSTITAVNPIGGALTVVTSTTGVNASTIAVTNAGGVALKVDGSATTQPISGTVTSNQGGTWTMQPGNTPNTSAWFVATSTIGVGASTMAVVNAAGTTLAVSGTVTANAGTNLNTSLLALESGGNLATLAGTVSAGKQNGNVTGSSVTVAVPNGTTLPVNATQTGTWNVGTVTAVTAISNALPTGTNNIGTVSGSSVVVVNPNNALASTVTVNGALPTGTNSIGNIGTVTTLTGITNALPAGANIIGLVSGSTVTTVYPNSVFAATVTVNGIPTVQGSVASGATASGNPVRNGGDVHTALPSALTDGQNMAMMLDKFGRQVTFNGCPRDLIGTSTITLTTDTTERVFVSSGAAGVFNDFFLIIAANTSATASLVTFRSGGGPAGGTPSFPLEIPPTSPAGFSTAMIVPQLTAAANWTVQSSASVTDIRLAAFYCKNK